MSTLEILFSLLTQLSWLVTCTLLFGVLKPFLKRINRVSRDLVQGSLFSGFAIVVMLNPIWVVDGVLFDLRGVIIVVAGALYGIIPASVVCIFVILYRLLLGGVGTSFAIGSALTGAALRIGFYLYKKQHAPPSRRALLSLGLAAALQTLVWLSLLPAEIAREVIAAIALPIFLIYPATSWIFGALLLYQERHLELEESLSTERNMLRTLIDIVPDYIFVKDKTKHFMLSNLAHAHAAGVTMPSELLERPAALFFPAEYVAQHEIDDEAVLRGNSLIGQERRTVNEDGTFIWVSTTKIPLRDAQGGVIGIVGISRDISASKQAEEALQHERNMLRALIDAVPANVFIKDIQDRFVDANVETIRKFGMTTSADLVGKTDFDFFTSDLASKYFADDQTVLQSGQPLLNIEEPTMDQRTQQPLWFLTTKAPIRNQYGEVTGLVGVGLDITERKQAEQALQAKGEAEQRFQIALKALYEITIELTQIDELDDFYRRVVELALERLGFDRFGLLLYDAENSRIVGTYGTDAQGKLVDEHQLQLNHPRLIDVLKRTIETTERFALDQDVELFSNEGSLGFGWNAITLLRNGEQNLGWIATDNGVRHQPVSKLLLEILVLYAQTVGTLLERKRVEQALRENEDKLQTFFEVLPVGVSMLNGDGQIVEMNPALERILGISMDGLRSEAYRSQKYIFNDGRPMQRSEFPSARARAEQKAVHDVVVGIVKEDETTVWTSISATPLPGVHSGVIVVTADITERKRIEQALEEERMLLRTLIDTMPDYIYIKDRESRFVIGNRATALSLGAAAPDEIVGKTDFDFHSPDLAARFFAEEQALLQSGTPLLNQEEIVIDQRTGERQILLATNVPLYDRHGQITGLVGVNRDITERKRAEEQAFALVAEQQRGRLMRDFVTDVSHDFRTPLTIIGTSAFLVGKTTDPVKLAQHSQRIEAQMTRLRLLLDNFVELAHLDEEASSLPFQSADLDGLVRTLLEQSQPEVAEKHQQLEYRCEAPAMRIKGSPDALTRAITQVLVNALHYTPDEGHITLHLYRDGENAVLQVADTGIGIRADDLPHIFESFYRVDSARSTATGGAGLGLSIAKRIVELMKGHIEVASEFGAGSVFKIYLPLER